MVARPLTLSPSYLATVRGTHELHRLIAEGKEDSPEAEAIRDASDGPWEALSETEPNRARWVAEDLYFYCVPTLIGRKCLLYNILSEETTCRKEKSDGETVPRPPGRTAGRCRSPAGPAAGRAATPGNLSGAVRCVAVASRAAVQRPPLRPGPALRPGRPERRGHCLPARPGAAGA